MNGQVNSIRKHPMRDRFGISASATLLAALEAAHRQIETGVLGLEAITSGDAPDAAQFGAIRLRIGQANLARTQIAREVCSHLISTTSIDEGEAVRDLQRREVALFRRVSEQVRHWTLQALRDDWSGYCEASRKVRGQVREIAAAEKKLLYPLLQRTS